MEIGVDRAPLMIVFLVVSDESRENNSIKPIYTNTLPSKVSFTIFLRELV
jgi:hypothetical protein